MQYPKSDFAGKRSNVWCQSYCHNINTKWLHNLLTDFQYWLSSMSSYGDSRQHYAHERLPISRVKHICLDRKVNELNLEYISLLYHIIKQFVWSSFLTGSSHLGDIRLVDLGKLFWIGIRPYILAILILLAENLIRTTISRCSFIYPMIRHNDNVNLSAVYVFGLGHVNDNMWWQWPNIAATTVYVITIRHTTGDLYSCNLSKIQFTRTHVLQNYSARPMVKR